MSSRPRPAFIQWRLGRLTAKNQYQHRPHRARDLRPPHSDDITMAEITDLATAGIRRRGSWRTDQRVPMGSITTVGQP